MRASSIFFCHRNSLFLEKFGENKSFFQWKTCASSLCARIFWESFFHPVCESNRAKHVFSPFDCVLTGSWVEKTHCRTREGLLFELNKPLPLFRRKIGEDHNTNERGAQLSHSSVCQWPFSTLCSRKPASSALFCWNKSKNFFVRKLFAYHQSTQASICCFQYTPILLLQICQLPAILYPFFFLFILQQFSCGQW